MSFETLSRTGRSALCSGRLVPSLRIPQVIFAFLRHYYSYYYFLVNNNETLSRQNHLLKELNLTIYLLSCKTLIDYMSEECSEICLTHTSNIICALIIFEVC